MAGSSSATAGTMTRTQRPSALSAFFSNLSIQRLGLILVLILLWQIYGQFFANHALLAPPSDVAVALVTKIFGDPKVVSALGYGVAEIVIAYVMAVVGGMAIGIAVGFTDFGRKSFLPVIMLLYFVPQVVLLPLLMLVFGIGPAAKIAFGFSHGIFPVIFNTVVGMRQVPELFVRSAKSTGASRAQIVRHVIFPNMVPQVFAGLRLSMTVTLLGVLLAELFVSTGGIGYYAQTFGQTYDPAPLFALITTLACLAIGMNELVRIIERRFTRWKN